MRIATWNVNSVKQRVPRLLPWLDQRAPDVVCLQETKLTDDAFTGLLGDELAQRGYEVAVHGESAWNGVAILSRAGLDDVVARPARRARASPSRRPARSRRRAATCASGRSTCPTAARRTPTTTPTSCSGWRPCATRRARRRAHARLRRREHRPDRPRRLRPRAYVGETHVTPPERAALAELQAVGLHDVVRDRWPDEDRVFSYWDYRAGMFHQDLGMRIDLILAGAPVAARARAAWIDRQARKGKGPSDHAPVIVDLDEAPDGDIGPVVPPPSAPAPRRGGKRLPQAP